MQSWRVVEVVVVVRQRRHVLDPIVITKTLGGWRYSEGEEHRGVIAHTHIQSGRGKSMNCERRGSIEQITIRANDSTICTTHSTYGHPKARCWSHIASAEDRHSTQPTCYPILVHTVVKKRHNGRKVLNFPAWLWLYSRGGWRGHKDLPWVSDFSPQNITQALKKKEERELARRKTGKSIERPEAGDI